MGTFEDRLGVSGPAAVVLAALIGVQLVLQVIALVDLARQPAGTPPPSKWLWLLVILFGNLLGAVVYLAFGRRQRRAAADELTIDRSETEARDKARAAADELYGPDARR